MEHYEQQFLECLALRGVSKRTKQSYVKKIRPLARYFNRSPETLSLEDLRKYFLYLINVKEYGYATLKSNLYSIRFFYVHILNFKKEDFNFFRLKREQKLPVVLTRDEVQKILSQISILDYKICLSLIYACGLRIRETITIKPADIDGERRMLHIRNGKGNRERTVPIPDKMYLMLREYWKTHRNRELLFPIRRTKDRRTINRSISARTLQDVMCLAVKKSGVVKKATCHTFRHSYATHLLEAGVNIRVIQRYLGHTHLTSTVIYLHLTNKTEEKSVELINELMSDL